MEQKHQKEQSLIQEKIKALDSKVSDFESATREKEEAAAEQKKAIIKEIADTVEGNQELSRNVISLSEEYARGFKDIEEREARNIASLENNIKEAEEAILRSETKIETLGEKYDTSSIEEEIDSLKNIIELEKQNLSSFKENYRDTQVRHQEFYYQREDAAKDVIGFAVDSFINGSFAGVEGVGKEELREEVKKEIKNRQKKTLEEKEKERIKRNIEEYDSVIEAVKIEFKVIQEKVKEELRMFENKFRDGKLSADIANKIEEKEKKEKKIHSRFTFESKKYRLEDEIREINKYIKNLFGPLSTELNNIVSRARYFLKQQEGKYDSNAKRLGNLGNAYFSYSDSAQADPELKTLGSEKVKAKDALLSEKNAWVHETMQKHSDYLDEISKIIPA